MTSNATIDPQSTAAWSSLMTARLGPPLFVLCLSILLYSMNTLLMATIMPSAVNEIGGLAYMAWPTTGFLAASVVSASSAGILRAALGARGAYILSVSIFGVGSLLSGIAPDIGVLITGRTIQGAGGGLLSALSYILIRNIFPENLWPRVLALLSSIWGVSALAGPFVGGVFSEIGIWRGAFFLVCGLSIILAVLGYILFTEDKEKVERGRFPAIRLATISAAILILSVAGTLTQVGAQTGLALAGMGLLAVAVWLDRRVENRLFPRDAFSLTTGVGIGLWIILFIAIANNPFPIYGPMFLQTIHAMGPLSAGYLVAMEALAWTLMALFVASLPQRYSTACLVAGPAVMGVGLIGSSIFMVAGPIWAIVLSTCIAGAGIGACFMFLSQRIMSQAQPGDEDRAASSVATVQMIGLAVGAALAGLAANSAGFSSGLSVETARSAALFVPGVFAGFCLLGFLASIRLSRFSIESD